MENAEITILIVDDDIKLRKVLSKILRRKGYTTLDAENGARGMELIKEHPISLVLSDIDMPEKSGIVLLAEIKEVSSTLPVIIVTGKPTVDAAVECMKIGASDFISKPFNIAKIEAVVEKALRNAAVACKPILPGDVPLENDPKTVSGFRFLDKLGEGTMGDVYLVDKAFEGRRRQFALKKFKPKVPMAGEVGRMDQRFLHEAKAASSVKHPNIVEIIEYGVDDADLGNFIVMEYVKGESLQDLIAKPGQFDYRAKALLISQIASGLHAIHEHNICHRDIKPANIMVTPDRVVKITDFSIARIPESMLTGKHDLMGSPGYMAPESFNSSRVDHRADIFSLGLLSYELLVGRHPFGAGSLYKLALQIQNDQPESPTSVDPDFPRPLDPILTRMLEKTVERRYQSAGDISRDIQSVIDAI